jgi:two-component system cell cycle sensor histidine kinase/response regulator CckA
MDPTTRRVSLKWKIGGVFAGVMLILGAVVMLTVYQLAQKAMRDRVERRVLLIAQTLSAAAAGYVAGGNPLALHALARKYTLLEGVAFAFVENSKGEITVHTLGSFPAELQPRAAAEEQNRSYRRELTLAGRPVITAGVPILEGQLGTVHVGVWRDQLEKEVQQALLPLVGIMAAVPLLGALLSFLLAHWMVRPLAGLTEIADKVTLGDLETSVSGKCVRSRDEIGDLARSLERMRSSLKAAMLRLGREPV